MKTLTYKGYVGSIEPDASDGMLYGTVMNISDGIGYEGATIEDLRASMKASIDLYLASCAEDGDDPQKPFSGVMQLRMEPTTHAELTAAARTLGVSVNKVANLAITSLLKDIPALELIKTEMPPPGALPTTRRGIPGDKA